MKSRYRNHNASQITFCPTTEFLDKFFCSPLHSCQVFLPEVLLTNFLHKTSYSGKLIQLSTRNQPSITHQQYRITEDSTLLLACRRVLQKEPFDTGPPFRNDAFFPSLPSSFDKTIVSN